MTINQSIDAIIENWYESRISFMYIILGSAGIHWPACISHVTMSKCTIMWYQ